MFRFLLSAIIALVLFTGCGVSQTSVVDVEKSGLKIESTFKAVKGRPGLGLDCLGLNKFSKACRDAIPRDWMLGASQFFGDSIPEIEKAADSGQRYIRIQIAPFDNSHNYDPKKYLPQVYKEAGRVWQLAVKYPRTTFFISPFCEHNHPRRVMDPIFRELARIAPGVQLVNSIWRGEETPLAITEIHLEDAKSLRKPKQWPYIVSLDGFGGKGTGDATDADLDAIVSFYNDAAAILIWNFRFNGKFGHKDKTALSARKHWATYDDARGHVLILMPREGSPNWPSNALLKPFADDHGQGGKDNKLMAILPEKLPSVDALDIRNNLITKMPRMLPDHSSDPKGARYYAPSYAYQIAEKAHKKTGSYLIRIRAGKKLYPLTDGRKRSGKFKGR
jgi:hypothetical protein